MKTLTHNNRLAKVWVKDLSDVEPQTLEQIKHMLTLPSLFEHIAVMPDTHLGKGAVVGGVVATTNTIVPNIVGVDIGCGMSTIKTGITLDAASMDRDFWMQWKSKVNRRIPVGFNEHKTPQDIGALGEFKLKATELQEILEAKASKQIGTLGGGNHFLEAQVDQLGEIWFMVHSGSRHTGLRIADYYNNKAKDLNIKYKDKTPEDLWFLRTDEESGIDYLHDMQWAIGFALENRWRMLEELYGSFIDLLEKKNIEFTAKHVRDDGINIHHNFANIENHFGEDVTVHRKGATQAFEDQIGIIPGSMGSSSYITKGKGISDSFKSSSHGAGRVMSRTQAKKELNQEDFSRALSDTFTKASGKFIDEAPGAYKNIDEVMENQKDLVDILFTLKPIITVKG